MNIAVDAAVLGVTDDRLKTGVFNFSLNLLEFLSKKDRANKYLLYSFDPIPEEILLRLGSNWSNAVLRPRKGWLSLRLSWEFSGNKPDVFLGLGQALPVYHPGRNIIFVYDLAFELYPQFYKETYGKLSRQTRFAVQHAEKVIAISHATKNDLMKLYKVKKEKIEVIYPGVDFGPSTPGESLHAGYPRGVSRQPYFLFVGSHKPGKNIQNIVKAFELFQKEAKKPYELVLAGSDYWLKDAGYKKADGVKLLGYVSEADLPGLYRGATAFISPSYYEGFGMPILEAMACGVPVITSNCGSIPEVVGGAGIMAAPDDVVGLKNAMKKIANDGGIRKAMAEKGLDRAKKFSWEKAAGELLKVINS